MNIFEGIFNSEDLQKFVPEGSSKTFIVHPLKISVENLYHYTPHTSTIKPLDKFYSVHQNRSSNFKLFPNSCRMPFLHL